MNQIKILTYLLTSIIMVGISSIDVSVSQSPPKLPSPTSATPDASLTNVGSVNSPKSTTSNDSMNWLFISSGILHLVTLGSLIYFFLKSKEISTQVEKNERSFIKKLDKSERDIYSVKTESSRIVQEANEKIKGLSEKQQNLESNIRNIQQEMKDSFAALAATNRVSSSRSQNQIGSINDLQPHSSSNHYSIPENGEPTYLNDYNDRQKNFTDIYRSSVVDRDAENYNLSRAGQTEDVILAEESRGNYWLFASDGLIHIVPSQKLKIREDKINEVKDLFDCRNYQESNYNNFILIKPALVSQKSNGTWRLKEKGTLQFG